jgi:hypothetical protein
VLLLSCCLSAAAICFLAVLFPPQVSASLTVRLSARYSHRTTTGFPCSALLRCDRCRVPPFTPGPRCSHGCHLDFSHHCRLPAAGPFPRYCFHLPGFWLTELAEIHSRSPFPVFPLPVTSGWNAGPWAFSRASHPAVTSDACQERERALSTRPDLTADPPTLHSSYLTQTVRPHVAPRSASSRWCSPSRSSGRRASSAPRPVP